MKVSQDLFEAWKSFWKWVSLLVQSVIGANWKGVENEPHARQSRISTIEDKLIDVDVLIKTIGKSCQRNRWEIIVFSVETIVEDSF